MGLYLLAVNSTVTTCQQNATRVRRECDATTQSGIGVLCKCCATAEPGIRVSFRSSERNQSVITASPERIAPQRAICRQSHMSVSRLDSMRRTLPVSVRITQYAAAILVP